MIVVFDIDGVLADAGHRQHFVEGSPRDWAGFFAAVGGDAVLERGVALLATLRADHQVVLLSGRPEHTRKDTEQWLHAHGIAYDQLILRPDSDRRPAAATKAALMRGIAPPKGVSIVVDDDEDVVSKLEALGYPTELFR